MQLYTELHREFPHLYLPGAPISHCAKMLITIGLPGLRPFGGWRTSIVPVVTWRQTGQICAGMNAIIRSCKAYLAAKETHRASHGPLEPQIYSAAASFASQHSCIHRVACFAHPQQDLARRNQHSLTAALWHPHAPGLSRLARRQAASGM